MGAETSARFEPEVRHFGSAKFARLLSLIAISCSIAA
jgi:hypothetical protein